MDTHTRHQPVVHGLIIVCKDMYTFDVSEEAATATYHEVCEAYENIFSTLSLPVSKGGKECQWYIQYGVFIMYVSTEQ